MPWFGGLECPPHRSQLSHFHTFTLSHFHTFPYFTNTRFPVLTPSGVDKRAMAAGPEAIDAELVRLTPLLKEGGFIPWCDHFVPPDVSLSDYQYYVRRMKEASLDPDGFAAGSG